MCKECHLKLLVCVKFQDGHPENGISILHDFRDIFNGFIIGLYRLIDRKIRYSYCLGPSIRLSIHVSILEILLKTSDKLLLLFNVDLR